MTTAGVLAAVAAIGTIVGGIVYVIKTGLWAFKKTPAEKGQDIDKEVTEQKAKEQAGERPKWD